MGEYLAHDAQPYLVERILWSFHIGNICSALITNPDQSRGASSMSSTFTEEFVQIGNSKLQLLKGGSGEPLLLLHGAGGNRGWLRYVQTLSELYTVYLPTHPGFGLSDRADWIQNIHDLACFYTWFQEKLDIEQIRCIGFSMGGWLAAEMAA